MTEDYFDSAIVQKEIPKHKGWTEKHFNTLATVLHDLHQNSWHVEETFTTGSPVPVIFYDADADVQHKFFVESNTLKDLRRQFMGFVLGVIIDQSTQHGYQQAQRDIRHQLGIPEIHHA